MAQDQIVAFYQTVRASPDMWDKLAHLPDQEALIDAVQDMAAARDTPLSRDAVRTALTDLPGLIAQAAENDELSDDELELVAAGTHYECKMQDV